MLLGLLGVILVSAKVFGYTALPWIAVTAPFWVPVVLVLAGFAISLAGLVVIAVVGK